MDSKALPPRIPLVHPRVPDSMMPALTRMPAPDEQCLALLDGADVKDDWLSYSTGLAQRSNSVMDYPNPLGLDIQK